MADLQLGESIDPDRHQRSGSPVKLPTSDLTTHGVIVGMTGSGKTGLAVVLLEEALAAGVPALLIDPKGDLGNLALVFPTLDGPSFAPWVDPSAAAAAGMSVDAFGDAQAKAWTEGLLSWGVTADRLRRFADDVDVAIYTPGSTAGVPLNVVGSLGAPPGADPDDVRDEIDGTVTGLLGLVGIDADPLSSREHILLANLVETAWRDGRSLDLAGLVAQIPHPPIRKLGVFDLDQFFPPADRMTLALRLNSLLASSAFAAWSRGQALDIDALLRTPDGRPRAAVVSIAHLSDPERQFVVSLLLSKVVTWMRRQSGTTDLRALVYLDEVAGYVPPTAVPPTKGPILTLMKQARAFGVGMVLATQNPVDLDYKALSNAGTWIIGRLQTERDKARLLDGLTAAAGGVDVAALDATISALGKREFVLKRAGKDRPEIFTSRWAMSYLRGPLTREQIAHVMADHPLLAPASAPGPDPGRAGGAPAPSVAEATSDDGPVMPSVASGIPVRFVDPAAPWLSELSTDPTVTRFEAAVVARVRLRFDDPKADLAVDEEHEVVLHPLVELQDPAAGIAVDYDDRDLLDQRPDHARYAPVAAPIADGRWWTRLRKDLTDQLSRDRSLDIQVNRELKLFSRPGETPEDFGLRCRTAAAAAADREAARLRSTYEAKLKRAAEAEATQAGRVAQLEAEHDGRIRQEVLTTAGSILGGFLGGRKSVGSILGGLGGAAGRRGRSSASATRLDTAQDRLERLGATRMQLEEELTAELAEIARRWDETAERTETHRVPLEKSDVAISQLVLVWVRVPG
jgi:hypothetical protein